MAWVAFTAALALIVVLASFKKDTLCLQLLLKGLITWKDKRSRIFDAYIAITVLKAE
ncbi:MAG: hypothetical protein ACK56F_15360 [bacterium]